jgi:uncharacterized membrane protein
LLTKGVSKGFVLALLFVSFLSLLKFNYCRATNWASPGNYVHACYTDIAALYSERELDTNAFPYQSATNSFEYPPIIGIGNWLLSFLNLGNNSINLFFDINAFLIIIFFIISAFLVRKINPRYSYLYPVAPAVGASLFINWDLWVVFSMILAIYYFDKKKFETSGIWLGVAIATKFFPVVFLLPIAIIFYRDRQVFEFIRYTLNTLLIYLAFNLPIAIFYFDGWWRFFKLNIERGAEFGSIWYGLSLLGINFSYFNLFSTIFTLLAIAYLIIYLIKLQSTPSLAQVAFLSVVAITTFARVYSPQYVLWLTPLAVIVITGSKQQIKFWLWQGGEIIYHLAIWQYLALFTGASQGLPAGGYAICCLLRVVLLIVFVRQLMDNLAGKSTVIKA